MRTIKYIIQFLFLLLLVVGGIYFGSENTDAIRIVIMGTLTDPIPIWFVVLIAFFAGAALSGIYFSVELIRLWMKLRSVDKGYRSKNMNKNSGGFKFSDSSGGSSTAGSGEQSKPRFSPFSSPGSNMRGFGVPPPPPPSTLGSSNR